jgi:hypothetical protein
VTGWEFLGVEIVAGHHLVLSRVVSTIADVAIHWKDIRSTVTAPVKPTVSRKQSLPENAVGAT